MTGLTDEYLALIEESRDAIHALLDESAHDAWSSLREGYGEIRRMLELNETAHKLAALKEDADQIAEQVRAARFPADGPFEIWRERRKQWRATPRDQRENLLLHVLGDERLTTGELAARMNRELDGDHSDGRLQTVASSDVGNLARRMFRDGQIEREPETFRNKLRYRYTRKRGLAGPIADLERAYHDDGEAVA
jgi:hypothetical protein